MGLLTSFRRYAVHRVLRVALTRWLPMAVILVLALPLVRPEAAPRLIRTRRAATHRGPAALSTTPRPPTRGTPAAGNARAAGEEVCFGPESDCGAVVIREIARARHAVRLQAFTFTSRRVARALATAQRRGVDVRAIVDASEARLTTAAVQALLDAGVPVRLDGAHALAHNKVVVIDNDEVLTGSFNFSVSAERYNAENLLVLRGDRQLAEAYLWNWGKHWEHSARTTAAPAR